jgi:hypothetical protein
LKRDLDLEGRVDLSLLAGIPDLIVVTEPPMLMEELGKATKKLLSNAVDSLDEMRQRRASSFIRI